METSDFYEKGHNPNNPDDTADYGDIMRDGWTLYDWKTWYYVNKAAYGQKTAVEKFINAWEKHSFFSWFEFTTYSFAKYDNGFHDFMQREGIDGSNIIADTADKIKGGVSNTGDIIENITAAGKKATGFISDYMPVILIAAVGLTALFIVSKAKALPTPPAA